MPAHPAFSADTGFAHLKLGRLAKRHDPRTLQMARYLDESKLPPIPATLAVVKVPTWPMYGNDRLGDCTCAAAGHMVEAWTEAAGKFTMPLDADVEHFYIPVTGHADTGRNEISVLNAWRKVGFGGDKITAYTEVEITEKQVQTGTYLFGGLYTGVALPITAQAQAHEWSVVGDGKTGDSAPGSWGGHAVPFVGYDKTGVYLVTWGFVMKATWGFVKTYFDEAYAVLSNDWLTKTGGDIHGFNLAQLETDLAAI